MKIKIKGLNQRGKSRITSFGINGEFLLLDVKPPTNRPNSILVESLKNCFRVGNFLATWSGWLEVGKEVEIVRDSSGFKPSSCDISDRRAIV